MKNDDRIQILTESGGNWTGTWEELIDVNPDWLADLHRVHVQDLIAILDQGMRITVVVLIKENGSLCSGKDLKYLTSRASKNIKKKE